MDDPKRVRTASVLLVDVQGRLLLQLRDGKAPVGPNKWAIPGGYINPGETPEFAAQRELREETGLVATNASFGLFWHGLRTFSNALGHAEWNVYCAATQAKQEDVVLGEGAAMVFLSPPEIDQLPLVENARYFVRKFLNSAHYQRLRTHR
ncbi:NUDIX domain-containing protein [Streptomyces cellostaticus]|uniref:NUDIX domain-containing protein n=1 Tax=Streptomyces cellostaticus TaxID=67285 RepID=UPI0035A97441